MGLKHFVVMGAIGLFVWTIGCSPAPPKQVAPPRIEDSGEEDIGVEPEKVLRVFNKIDCLNGGNSESHGPDENGDVWVSAVTGVGMDGLKEEGRRRLG